MKSSLTATNKYLLYSSFKSDPLINAGNENGLISCGGIVESVDENVPDLAHGDIVGYLSLDVSETINLSSNIAIKLSRYDPKLLALIPYGSYAMKVLRLVNPSIGMNVLIYGMDQFSLLLSQLMAISGANIFMLGSQASENIREKTSTRLSVCKNIAFLNSSESTMVHNLPKLDRIIVTNGFTDFLAFFENARLTLLQKKIVVILSNEQEFDVAMFVKKGIEIAVIDDFRDVGLDDPHYVEGVKYPTGYVRWHFRENLRMFINLYLKNELLIDFFEVKVVTIDSILDYKNKMKNLAKGARYLFVVGQT